jgi:hypothetical protein
MGKQCSRRLGVGAVPVPAVRRDVDCPVREQYRQLDAIVTHCVTPGQEGNQEADVIT